MNLNALAKEIHAENIKWWQDPATGQPIERNPWELLALVLSEISECLEGERKNLMDDKLPHRKMAEVEMADAYIRLLDFSAGFDYELPDEISTNLVAINPNKGAALYALSSIVVRVGDGIEIVTASETAYGISEALGLIRAYCEKHGYDLDGAIAEKRAFNRTRADHKHEARLIAGGKQF